MFLANLFRGIGTTFRALFYPLKLFGKMLAPLFKFEFPPWLKYFLELILMIVVVAGCLFINWYFDLQQYLSGSSETVERLWLPILAVLSYAAIRLFIYILQQLPSREAAYPDIDAALEAGLAALAEARIAAQDSPVYLVVGMPEDSESAFAESSMIGKEVQVTDRDLPIHWYGDRDAIWVTIPGVSALAKQASVAGRSTAPGPPVDEPATPAGKDQFGTMMADSPAGRFATMGAVPASGGFATVADEPAAPSADAEGYRTAGRRLDLDEKDLADRRIRYFVRRLCEARYPVCAVNGVLLVFPYEWTTSPGLSQMADTAKVDMLALQEVLGVKCLCLTLFMGIEKSLDFTEYVDRLDRGQTMRRCGCGFPSLINPDSRDIDKTHAWLVTYFEQQVFELFQRKLGDPGNGRLVRFLDAFRKSRPNFSRLLNHAFPAEVDEPFYFGGVYYAGAGQVGAVRMPFFDGVIDKMVSASDEVIGWNRDSLAEDRRLAKTARTLMGGVVVLTVVAALLVLAIFFGIGG